MERSLLAGGPGGTETVHELVELALRAAETGAAQRGGPAPAGGPAAVAALCGPLGPILADAGVGAEAALAELTELLFAGSVQPANAWCAAHLHCPPLAVAAVADLLASMLNPSLDSWDQAPIASELERLVTAEFATLCFPAATDSTATNPDAVLTSGGTEANLLGLLLARDHDPVGPLPRPVCGANAHHSVARAAWQLGLPQPVTVACPGERMNPRELADTLYRLAGPTVVVATAGTTNAGTIDPLPTIADVVANHRSRLHVDAAYGGPVLFSPHLRDLLAGLDRADSVALDLHKFGWQPIAAGLLAVADATALRPLDLRADYLNAADDTEAGLPDLLGRSIRTSRRADGFRIAVSLRALGRTGLAELVEHCVRTAAELARAVAAHPELRCWGSPTLSTVLLRPTRADRLDPAAGDELVAGVRRRLLTDGVAVLGRARVDDRLWLKLTLLNPTASTADYLGLLDRIAAVATELPHAADQALVEPAW